MPLAIGQVLISRYRMAALLGQGGMGAVYCAWDLRLHIPVAVKELVPQPGLDPHLLAQLRRQFQQEAVVLAQLEHPHLVSVTDFFEVGDNDYLVMKLIEGENLAERIAQVGALPEAQILTWVDQLLDAVTYCHGQGVVHRDIKPQNIIIRAESGESAYGQVVLVDFGLVKLWNPDDPCTRTAMRGMGTPAYAPPEQYGVQPGHTDPRSDLYSLGATLYHALAGQSPPTVTDRMANPGRFVPIRKLNPGVSARTGVAVMKAMELARNQRFCSAEALRKALIGEEQKRRPAWLWGVIGVLALVLVGGEMVGADSSSSDADTVAISNAVAQRDCRTQPYV